MSYLDKKYSLEDKDFPSSLDQLSLWSSYFGKLLLDHVPIQKGMKVLDVGCGTGFPILELAQMLGPDSQLIGLDPWEIGLERAKWKSDKIGLKNVEFIIGDAAEMPFEKEEFDLIVSNVGINNFSDPQNSILECHRVLKPEAKVCLTTNLNGNYREFYQVFEVALKELDKNDLLPGLAKNEEHRGTDESVRNLLESAGFSAIKMVRDRFQTRFADGTALLNNQLSVVGFLSGWRSFIPAEEEKIIFDLLEKKLNEKAAWDGHLTMSVPILYVEGVK